MESQQATQRATVRTGTPTIASSGASVTSHPSTATPPKATATARSSLVVEQWDELLAPTPQPGRFWASDEPIDVDPLGFGLLVPDQGADREQVVRSYRLATVLPDAPAELSVYLLGDYPSRHFASAGDLLRNKDMQGARSLQGWSFNPEYSLLQYSHPNPIGSQSPIRTREQAEQRAKALLQQYGLLMPDAATPQAIEGADGTWLVFFFRHINQSIVYTAQAMMVRLNQNGQAGEIVSRRRPLLAQSRYPLRSAEEAWNLLRQGRGLPIYIDDLAPDTRGLSGTVEQFVVETIELAYVETQVLQPRQIMQPYYVFRNEQGYTLYVPAVADPHIEWPQPASKE